jgi:parallel beta-helix repeat protein
LLVASDNVLLRAALADCIALPWGELPDMRSYFRIGAVTQRTKKAKAVARRAAAAGSVLSVAIATTVLASVPASAATTYTVDNTNASCSDTGPGNAAQPFCTLTKAAAKAASGDTVQVIAGTYTASSASPASGVTFAASPGVTISGGASGAKGFSVSSKSNVVISGFTITNTPSYGIYVNSSSNVTISGNTVSFAGQPVSGQSASGIYLSGDNGGLITANVTHDNAAHGILLTGSTTGVTVQGNTSYHNAYQWQRNANGIDDTAPGNSIIGNLTYANEDSGINIYPSGNSALVAGNVTYGNGDHGIDDFNVTGGRIIGNTVYGNCTDGINVEGSSGNYDIENNVSMNNATGAIINPTPINPPGAYTNDCNRRVGNIGVYDSAPASTTANYNLVWQSGAGTEYTWAGTSYSSLGTLQSATGQESHGIFANPKFIGAGGGNFQLSAGSPAIDSANAAASGEQTTDILGNSRTDDPATPNTGNPAGSFYDRGAYEYQGGGGTPTGPTAALTVSPASGTAPLAVTADASGSTAGSAPISSYSFNFGDGTTAGPQSGATATHTYQSAGSYTVTVTATDGNNQTSNASETVTVSAQSGSTAKFINQIATNWSTNSHTSGSITVWRTGGVAAGDLMILTAQLTGTSATGAVTGTDSKGDTLSVANDASDGSGNRLVTLSGIAQSGLAVNDVITLTFPTASTYRITGDEVSGVTAVDQHAAASGSGSTFSSGSTGTISRSGEFVFAAVGSFGGTTLSWDPGWTSEQTYTVNSNALGRAYRIPSATGTFAASGTSSGTWLAEIATFR